MNLSEVQILALAPDESSRKSGKELANASKWSNLGVNSKSLWGDCQGSGKNPYKTQVDLSNIAFKCSCPSRKFPCKHGLGIVLLYLHQKQLFNQADSPQWVNDWIEKREEKSEKKVEKNDKPIDVEAQAKRAQQRQKKVDQGVDELQLVLKDIVRNGIMSIPEKSNILFDNLSKRMIDSQASGLAFMVKELSNINYFKENWQSEFVDQIVKIHVATSAFKIQEQLPELLKEEVRSLIGFSKNTNELKQQDGIKDNWLVLAKKTEQQDHLHVQKNWLFGLNCNKYALIVQFYVQSQMPDINLTPGTIIEAELSFYKSVNLYRAIIKTIGRVVSADIGKNGFSSWTQLLDYEKKQIQSSPFIFDQIYLINNLSLAINQNELLFKDQQEIGIPLILNEKTRLNILVITGGKLFDLVISGIEGGYKPMAIILNNSYFAL